MSSKAYIVPSDFTPPGVQENYRVGALAAAIQRAYIMGVQSWDTKNVPLSPQSNTPNCPDLGQLIAWLKAGNWPQNLDAREFEPTLDAGAGAGLDFWYTAALAVAGTEYSALGAVATAPAANRIKRIVVFYGVQILTTPNPINRILFRRNGPTGLLQAEFDVQQLATMMRVDGFFSEPVVWDNNTAYSVDVLCQIATGVAAQVIFKNFVLEPAGTTNV